MPAVLEKKYQTFAEFYASYLSQHSNRTCRQLHFVGSTLALIALLLTGALSWLLVALVCGYGFAWIGPFAFEKKRLATFKQPLYSFLGDWVMYWQMLTGQVAF